MIAALLEDVGLDQLRQCLAGWTVEVVQAALRPGGDLDALTRLFVLGDVLDEGEARAALAPLPLPAARTAGLIERDGDRVRARLDIRPHADDAAGQDWWVVADLPPQRGALHSDHVLGVGTASMTLAQAVVPGAVGRALDIGTGCGVQALHLAGRAQQIVATDTNRRALRLAATTAGLAGQQWDLRHGSLLEPVTGERFDLIVANPPFVLTPGWDGAQGGLEYRDAGIAGDGVVRTLIGGLPGILAEGGTAQLLANWLIPADGAWADRIADWLPDGDCDVWVWQREVADPVDYVELWLTDSGVLPGTDRWTHQSRAWLDWFTASGAVAVGMGSVTLRRSGRDNPCVVCEDVPQVVHQPVGAQIEAWLGRLDLLARTTDAGLMALRPVVAAGVERVRHQQVGPDGWYELGSTLRQRDGLGWEVEVDDAVGALLAGCAGEADVGLLVSLLAGTLAAAPDEVERAVVPVLRDLIQRGFLVLP